MLLNDFERYLVTHSMRSWVQRWWDIPLLRRLARHRPLGRTAELGCGAGHALKPLSQLSGITDLGAFEIDAKFLSLAREKSASLQRVTLAQADIRQIPAKDAAFDSIFEFNVLHHVEGWGEAIQEASRILKPGGIFYAQETLKGFIDHPVWSRCMAHPRESRFLKEDFIAVTERAGFRVLGTQSWGNQFLWLAAEKERRASGH
ncbi:MAG: class I SAM-dependent methyltransferase [Planctomycetota bacterium]|nr:class I SAM-dependent methyltransferase [Planctomycetota bacterium]